MITNKELLDMYFEINEEEEVKALKLKEIYNAIVENDYSNVWSEMAERFNVTKQEWRIYQAICIRVIKGQLEIESLG